MAAAIDLPRYVTADGTSAIFGPARVPAQHAQPAQGAKDAAQCAARTARDAAQPRTAARRVRALGYASVRRHEILAGWLIALMLLLGIAASSLVGGAGTDRGDTAVRPIPRGVPAAPAAAAPDRAPRDDRAHKLAHGDE